jgi:siroheme synthase
MASADEHTTLVVYMGLATLPKLASQLQTAGYDADMPAVAIERGTTPQQRSVFAPLRHLVAEVGYADLRSPTLIIIGRVVALSPLWDMRHSARSADQSLAQSHVPTVQA